MPRDPERAFFGHPVGLRTLFFTEMWERFSYYGMRAFLVFYLAAPESLGGRGMFETTADGGWKASASAGALVGVFGASVYLLSLPGGWIADRFFGQRKAVTYGGIGIALGNAVLAIPGTGNFFYVGLVLIALGTGFLKPNVSTIVGQLYSDGDVRRDAGYTIYYMGINIGATIAPLLLGFIAGQGLVDEGFRTWLVNKGIDPNMCWHVAFAITSLGMFGGLIQYTLGQNALGSAGKEPTIPSDPVKAQRDRTVLYTIIGVFIGLAVLVVATEPSQSTITDVMGIGLVIGSTALFFGLYAAAKSPSEKRGIIAMIPLFLGAVGFFGIFEQAPTTLNTFAAELTEREFLGLNIPAAFWQAVNGLFIVILAPVFAAIWVGLARKKKEPSSVSKFAIGMAILSISFVVMLPATGATSGNKVSAGFLIGLYFFNTCAELCISPVGLSSMSKLAPRRLAGMVMGMWFLGTAIGIYLAGRASEVSSKFGYDFLFKFLIGCSLVVSAILFVVSPIIRKMMSKDAAEASGPADQNAKAEPEPLPTARVVKDD